jgi:hypothetical protein
MTIVSEGIGMPGEVFVYKINLNGKPVEGDTFNHVACVNDLIEYPKVRTVGSEDVLAQIPFYRKSQVDLILRSAKEADTVWEMIKTDVEELVENWHAAETLKAVAVYTKTIDEETTSGVEDLLTMSTQYLIQLTTLTNGTATESSGDQDITAPFDIDIKGWLPVAQVPGHFIDPVPADTKFFYNIDKHSELKALFPLGDPLNTHVLSHEGKKLPYGITGAYQLTRDTIYWNDFVPGVFSEYGVVGNAPWAVDYVDRNNPGEAIDLTLLVFVNNN